MNPKAHHSILMAPLLLSVLVLPGCAPLTLIPPFEAVRIFDYMADSGFGVHHQVEPDHLAIEFYCFGGDYGGSCLKPRDGGLLNVADYHWLIVELDTSTPQHELNIVISGPGKGRYDSYPIYSRTLGRVGRQTLRLPLSDMPALHRPILQSLKTICFSTRIDQFHGEPREIRLQVYRISFE